jgi:hypothetical protein
MPNTTNFNWPTPADTDLVKDGAAAIRNLGNGVDTSLIDLKGGTTGQILSKASNADMDFAFITPNVGDLTEVQAGVGISVASGTGPIPIITNSSTDLITTAGDLLYGTAADTVARLGIGTASQVLAVNSGATAPEWVTPAAGGGFTEISSTSPSGVSTVTFSSIPATYKHLVVSVKNLKIATPNFLDLRVRFNGITSTDYVFYAIKVIANSVTGATAGSQTAMRFGDTTADATNNFRNLFGEIWIYNYAVAHNPSITGQMSGAVSGGDRAYSTFRGLLDSQQAVTSITLFDNGSQNFTGGTIYLYGVS